MEVLFELLGEILLQVFGEVLAEWGLRSLAEPFRREPKPWLAVIGYTIFGACVGLLSLLVVRHHLMSTGSLRVLNLLITPVVAGFVMTLIGAWHLRRGEKVLRIDRFAYGYLFALAFAAVRFKFAS